MFFDTRASAYVVASDGFAGPFLRKMLEDAELRVVRMETRLNFGALSSRQVDLLFLDAECIPGQLPWMLREVRRRCPETRICIFSTHGEPQWIIACLANGASAIFSKFAQTKDIVAGLRIALGKKSFVDPHFELNLSAGIA